MWDNILIEYYKKGTAHCADMYPSGKNDLPSLIMARLKIGTIIGNWLSEK